MLMHQFHKSPRTWPIYAQFSSYKLFKVRALGWNHCFAVMASNRNNPGRSSVERQYLQVIDATLPFGEKKRSKRYMIKLASSVLAEKAFERCQRSLKPMYPWFTEC